MRKTILIATLGGFLFGCAGDGEPVGPTDLSNMKLALHGANEGVDPDQSVLTDPANPFVQSTVGEKTIWDIQSKGGAVAAFYVWATANARGANGERQFYTALDMKAIYEQALAMPEDMEAVRANAIKGFQVVLDKFPDSVTYAADGVTTYDLATPSVQGILDLGGKPAGGWVLVTTDNGGKMAVRR